MTDERQLLHSIYGALHSRMETGDLGAVDDLLYLFDAGRMPPSAMIAALMATIPIKDRLAERGPFFDRALAELRRRGEHDEARELEYYR